MREFSSSARCLRQIDLGFQRRLRRQHFQEVSVCGVQVRGLRAVAAMHQYSEADPECCARCNDDSALLFTRKRLATKWIGYQQTAVASEEPTGAEVHGVGHDGDAGALALDDPAGIAPLCRSPPHVPLVDAACAVDDGTDAACLRVHPVALVDMPAGSAGIHAERRRHAHNSRQTNSRESPFVAPCAR